VEIAVAGALQAAREADATAPVGPEALPARGAPQRVQVQVARQAGRAVAPAVHDQAPADKPDLEQGELHRQEALGRVDK